MTTTSHRLLQLLTLLQDHRRWTGNALADRFDVSTRTIRRDMDRLRALGYPVNAARGPGGSYRLSPGADLPPLLFDDEQAIAVAVALQTAPTSVLGLGDAARRALTSIQNLMPTRLAHRLQTIDVTSIRNDWDLSPPAVDSAVLSALSSALQNREVLRLRYTVGDDQAANGIGLRVEPHKLVTWSGRWYLVAYEQVEKAWRAFRVDRLELLDPPGWRFKLRELPNQDVVAFVQSQPNRGDVSDHWPCQGQVVIHLPPEVVSRWVPGGANVEELGPGACRVTMGAWSWVGLAALIGTFDADFDIEGPAELHKACTQLADRYARSATSTTSEPVPPPVSMR